MKLFSFISYSRSLTRVRGFPFRRRQGQLWVASTQSFNIRKYTNFPRPNLLETRGKKVIYIFYTRYEENESGKIEPATARDWPRRGSGEPAPNAYRRKWVDPQMFH